MRRCYGNPTSEKTTWPHRTVREVRVRLAFTTIASGARTRVTRCTIWSHRAEAINLPKANAFETVPSWSVCLKRTKPAGHRLVTCRTFEVIECAKVRGNPFKTGKTAAASSTAANRWTGAHACKNRPIAERNTKVNTVLYWTHCSRV